MYRGCLSHVFGAFSRHRILTNRRWEHLVVSTNSPSQQLQIPPSQSARARALQWQHLLWTLLSVRCSIFPTKKRSGVYVKRASLFACLPKQTRSGGCVFVR